MSAGPAPAAWCTNAARSTSMPCAARYARPGCRPRSSRSSTTWRRAMRGGPRHLARAGAITVPNSPRPAWRACSFRSSCRHQHQRTNAEFMAANGAAIHLPQSEADRRALAELLRSADARACWPWPSSARARQARGDRNGGRRDREGGGMTLHCRPHCCVLLDSAAPREPLPDERRLLITASARASRRLAYTSSAQ